MFHMQSTYLLNT